MAVGIGFSILGGFVSARMAKKKALLYGGLSTILCLTLAVFTMISTNDFGIKHFGSKLLTIGLGVLGGFIQMRMNRNVASPLVNQEVA